ncbi:hypothetical protein CA85_02540 [Allorhodopirellula solitaria]|uniref:Uncharacterized protein n=2 Tax=Allorhodopirellula solitaria TaxID=2527987 RepID=A0A5C5YJB8_9BACT|nr:hypothetical protein CA85_02540 [Allorhodopirellula solitaria]
MDLPDRVPPFQRAMPDSGVAGDRSVAEEADGRSAMAEISVDEMVRDLDLDLENESLGEPQTRGAAEAAPADSQGASEADFATIGVRNLEWRLPIIRSAAHRSADAIALSQIVDPSPAQEDQLTQIVMSTYRLIDPRFRGSYFQQVRVGRMLPMVLQHASEIDGTPVVLQPTHGNDQQGSIRLFGHAIPVTAASGGVTPAATPQVRGGLVAKQATRKQLRRLHDSPTYRAEAIEVLAELQARSKPTRWQRWLREPRLIVGLAGGVVLLILSIAVYRNAAPPEPLAGTEEPVTRLAPEPAIPADQLTDRSTVSPSLPDSPVPATTIPQPAGPEPTAAETPLPHSPRAQPIDLESVNESPATVPDMSQHQLTTEELMAALANVAELPEIDLPMTEEPATTGPATTGPASSGADSLDRVPEPMNPTPAEILSIGNDRSAGPTPAAPAPSSTEARVFDESAITSAVSTLWSETDSAEELFTDSAASDLIDQWDLIAELAGSGSLESVAASRLKCQASWLVMPFSEIVSQLRQAPDYGVSMPAGASASELANSSNLNAKEIYALLESWRAARKRVVRTSDLDQMLRQANVLIDRIVVSERLSARDRSDSLAAFRIDVEQLARICSDEESVSELNNLFAAIDTLPSPSEWERLESAEHPSGLMASIFCLQQRRWNKGIAWLGQTSNLSVAAAAKAEWKVIQSMQVSAGPTASNQDALADLASRWSKIADRLGPREASAVRLHAIDLYGDEPESSAQRSELQAQLPLYLQP